MREIEKKNEEVYRVKGLPLAICGIKKKTKKNKM